MSEPYFVKKDISDDSQISTKVRGLQLTKPQLTKKIICPPMIAVFLLLHLSSQSLFASGLVNGSFESIEEIEGIQPITAGNWTGDPASFVSESQGITPFDGNLMLNFGGTFPSGAVGFNSELWQLVDVRHLRDKIDSGEVTANISAHFNRVHVDEFTDNLFGLALTAFDGELDSYPKVFKNPGLARLSLELISDEDTSTWELLSGNLFIPPGATFLAVNIRADENIFNDNSFPEFDGHFVDAVTLVIPEPSGFILAITSLIICCFGKRWYHD